jgi:hypothetical protein
MSFVGKILIELVGQTISITIASLVLMTFGLEIKWAVPMALIITSINNGVSKIDKLTKNN